MRDKILGAAKDAGMDFAHYDRKDDEELDEATLLDAFHTGHVTPFALGEAFIEGVFEGLGLEDSLEQRRDDAIEAIELVLHREHIFASSKDRLQLAQKIVDALHGKEGRLGDGAHF